MTVTNSSPKWDLEYQRWVCTNWSSQQILFPLNVMKFTRSFIGAARQHLLLFFFFFIEATTPGSMCGVQTQRRLHDWRNVGEEERTHAGNHLLQIRAFLAFLTGAPVGGSQCHRVPGSVKRRRSCEAAGSAKVPPCRRGEKKEKIKTPQDIK